ncbi:MAG: ADP-ribosylglycohydrolase [Verrucomicrobiales bacterium]|jgi:ADP-ribosylglycohydrolase
MTDFKMRRAGLLFGSFSAEALSLGVHWIYDPDELAQRHGRVIDYKAPGANSYHPHKQAGDQGHVGDQALRLQDFLQREQRWDAASFMDDWIAMWPTYNDYVDKATKTTLANVQNGTGTTDAGSESDELAGPARIAPLVAFLADAPEDEVVQAAVEQTKLTHRSAEAEEAATFLATASYRILHGGSLEDTIRETAPDWTLKAADTALPLHAVEAIAELGPTAPFHPPCPQSSTWH